MSMCVRYQHQQVGNWSIAQGVYTRSEDGRLPVALDMPPWMSKYRIAVVIVSSHCYFFAAFLQQPPFVEMTIDQTTSKAVFTGYFIDLLELIQV